MKTSEASTPIKVPVLDFLKRFQDNANENRQHGPLGTTLWCLKYTVCVGATILVGLGLILGGNVASLSHQDHSEH